MDFSASVLAPITFPHSRQWRRWPSPGFHDAFQQSLDNALAGHQLSGATPAVSQNGCVSIFRIQGHQDAPKARSKPNLRARLFAGIQFLLAKWVAMRILQEIQATSADTRFRSQESSHTRTHGQPGPSSGSHCFNATDPGSGKSTH
jgi:hypothetical protein